MSASEVERLVDAIRLIIGGILIGVCIAIYIKGNIEIQQVKQVEDTYYITINNEIYEYEMVKE